MYCKKCGSQISSRAKVCPACGCPQDTEESIQDNEINWGIYLVSCLIPIVGIVLIWDKNKVKAKSGLEGAIIGLIFQTVASFIFLYSLR